jgi:Holliday junction resolvase
MSKGSNRERQLVELYGRAGFATYRPATVRYGENDMFDVMALSPEHDRIHAIQVKSNRATGLSAWRRHTSLFRQFNIRTLYAVPVDREGWIIYDAGKEPADKRRAARVVVDERESNENMGELVVEWLEGEQAGDRDD